MQAENERARFLLTALQREAQQQVAEVEANAAKAAKKQRSQFERKLKVLGQSEVGWVGVGGCLFSWGSGACVCVCMRVYACISVCLCVSVCHT